MILFVVNRNFGSVFEAFVNIGVFLQLLLNVFDLGFVFAGTVGMSDCLFFYDYVFSYILFVCIFVCFLIYFVFVFGFENSCFMEDVVMEVFWTLFSVFILVSVFLPSFSNLYSLDLLTLVGNFKLSHSVKVVGSQWFWSYVGCINRMFYDYDSYMSSNCDGAIRLLDCSKPILIESNAYCRFLISSTDVIHSFSVNSFGLKVDAVPGRVNYGFCFVDGCGLFYGQCSELCGENHSFMPIVVECL